MNTSIGAAWVVLTLLPIVMLLIIALRSAHKSEKKRKARYASREAGRKIYYQTDRLTKRIRGTLYEYHLLQVEIEELQKSCEDDHYRELIAFHVRRMESLRALSKLQGLRYAHQHQIDAAIKTLGLEEGYSKLHLLTAIQGFRQRYDPCMLERRNAPEDVLAEAATRLKKAENAYLLLNNMDV